MQLIVDTQGAQLRKSEEFRPIIVDTLVLRLLRQGLLEPTDFGRREDRRPGVVMTDDARRFLIARYEERLEVKVRHPAWNEHLTFRQCIERQVEHMARCILGRDGTYSPLLIR
jgi:CRISPR-associated protein Cas1